MLRYLISLNLFAQNMIMADEESSNHSGRSDASSERVVGSSAKSGHNSPTSCDAVKEEEAVHKPSLSFSIARLINSPERSGDKSPASSAPSSPVSSGAAPPVYPIPMWPPTSQSGRLPSAFPGFMPAASSAGYSSSESHFNQMIRNVLHHSGFANETVSTLMRHYQQLYGAHPPAGLLPPSPPPLLSMNQPSHLQHKVDILRSAAAASLSSSLQRPLIPAPHHSHGESFETKFLASITFKWRTHLKQRLPQ